MEKLSKLALTAALCMAGIVCAQSEVPTTTSGLGEQQQTSLAALQEARLAFEALVQAYERADVLSFERQLDASLIGRSRMLDALRRDANAMRNVRVHLSDFQLSAGPDVAVVKVRWEKRFLSANNLQPGLQTGNSVVLMHRERDGWRMASLGGDNVFGSPGGVRGTLTVSPSSIALSSLPITAVPYSPFVVEVNDADLIGNSTISVAVTSPQGEREVIVLSAVGAGLYRSNLVQFNNMSGPGGPVIAGNNVVEVVGATTLSVLYVDQTPGGNRPAITLTRRIPVR